MKLFEETFLTRAKEERCQSSTHTKEIIPQVTVNQAVHRTQILMYLQLNWEKNQESIIKQKEIYWRKQEKTSYKMYHQMSNVM